MKLDEAKKILKNSGYMCEHFEVTNKECRLETVGDLIDVLKELPRTFSIQIREGNEDCYIGMIAQTFDDNGYANKVITLFPEK